MKRKETGDLGEKLAGKFLRKNGYRICGTNYRCPHGEIDIIAEKKDYLVFIEVRTKRSNQFGTPEESVTYSKKKKLKASALAYMDAYPLRPGQFWRIDFVAVELDRDDKATRIELIENAIGA
jgi:putative endonuclease